jgi:hypothetical protein
VSAGLEAGVDGAAADEVEADGVVVGDADVVAGDADAVLPVDGDEVIEVDALDGVTVVDG